jgi:AraC family transcriptional regulator of adaptative response/methylated-DNA-[protein]-cysteine methyltransferase
MVHEENSIINLLISFIETPLSSMYICASEVGVWLLEFSDEKDEEKDILRLSKKLHANITKGSNRHIEMLEIQLAEYFDGKRKEFSIQLDLNGTEFQLTVWNELLKIPFGETRTYSEQSIAIGNIETIRAVAHANGLNPVAIVVPCHRVVGANGKLTGYAGGLWRKKWLLQHEFENTEFRMR